jgi:hypothetical protein
VAARRQRGGRCGGWGAVGGGRGCVLPGPSLPSPPPPRGHRGFLQPAVPPVCVCAAYQIKRLVCGEGGCKFCKGKKMLKNVRFFSTHPSYTTHFALRSPPPRHWGPPLVQPLRLPPRPPVRPPPPTAPLPLLSSASRRLGLGASFRTRPRLRSSAAAAAVAVAPAAEACAAAAAAAAVAAACRTAPRTAALPSAELLQPHLHALDKTEGVEEHQNTNIACVAGTGQKMDRAQDATSLAYICAMCPAAQQSPDPRSSTEPRS